MAIGSGNDAVGAIMHEVEAGRHRGSPGTQFTGPAIKARELPVTARGSVAAPGTGLGWE